MHVISLLLLVLLGLYLIHKIETSMVVNKDGDLIDDDDDDDDDGEEDENGDDEEDGDYSEEEQEIDNDDEYDDDDYLDFQANHNKNNQNKNLPKEFDDTKYPNHTMRGEFLHNFQQRCMKYSFVEQYLQQFSSESFKPKPHQRYLIFTYQDDNISSGGMGDRMGGIITAFLMAMRFNRTLIIKGPPAFTELFRPFHPKDILRSQEQFLWENWKSWTSYETFLESQSKNNNDENITKNLTKIEQGLTYNLTHCVSDTLTEFTDKQIQECSMELGDVDQPIVSLASNRAYLCRWDTKNTLPMHRILREQLHISAKDDLFEIAGCIMRLTLWPTDMLWKQLDQLYYTHLTKISQSMKRKEKKNENQLKLVQESMRILLDPPPKQMTLLPHVIPYQLGMHMRCGDAWSYSINNRLPIDLQYQQQSCQINNESPEELERMMNEGIKSYYMKAGTPQSIGSCATSFVHLYNQLLLLPPKKHRQLLQQQDPHRFFYPSTKHIQEFLKNTTTNKPIIPMILYAASDHPGAIDQMVDESEYPIIIKSPPGCHIDFHLSKICYQQTARYWFLLAQSDMIISQTFGEKLFPTSAFSRYAGLYSLHSNKPFRSGKICGYETYTTKDISRYHQGNWFCEKK